jgi:hypothetical protein
MLIKHRPCHLN